MNHISNHTWKKKSYVSQINHENHLCKNHMGKKNGSQKMCESCVKNVKNKLYKNPLKTKKT